MSEETTTTEVLKIAGTIEGVKSDIGRILALHDEKMKIQKEDSYALMWDRAWEVKDANDLVGKNLRNVEVIIQDLYRTLMKDREQHVISLDLLKEEYKTAKTAKDKNRIRNLIRWQERDFGKLQIEQLKMINALMRTEKELANEIRQSAMARRFNVHITEVKKLLLGIRAVLHDRIQDVNLLCRISDDLEMLMKKILPVRADGDY